MSSGHAASSYLEDQYGLLAPTVPKGADRIKVVQMILSGAWKRVLAGLGLGLPLAVGAGYLISAELYGVSKWDPIALTIATAALAASAFIAAMIPAQRAASISPMNALRTE
jgi:hypothetical protein